MKRVLFINWMGELGGAEIALLRILKNLDRTHYEPHVWIFKKGPLKTEAERWGAKVTVTAYPRFRFAMLNPIHHLRLLAYLEHQKINCVIGVGTLGFLLGKFAAAYSKCPLIWWMMDIADGTDFNLRMAGRWKADLFLAITHAVAKSFRKYFPQNPSPVKTLLLPAEAVSIPGNAAAARKALNLPEKSKIISIFGRIQRWKGQKVFIESIPAVLQKFPDCVFLIAGGVIPGMEDGYEEEIKQTAEKMGIMDHCRFLGHRSDTAALMELSDVVVHASVKPEPLGLVVMEAMLLGKPVIASAEGGPAELIDHGENGILIPSGQPETLASAIMRLLAENTFRAALGLKAAAKAAKQFTAPSITRQFEALLAGTAK